MRNGEKKKKKNFEFAVDFSHWKSSIVKSSLKEVNLILVNLVYILSNDGTNESVHDMPF